MREAAVSVIGPAGLLMVDLQLVPPRDLVRLLMKLVPLKEQLNLAERKDSVLLFGLSLQLLNQSM